LAISEFSIKDPSKGNLIFSLTFFFSHWWQYLVVVLLFVLALSFFLAGQVQSIVFDKQLGELQLWKTSLYCTKDVRRYPLEDISDVKAYKEGHSGINVYTLHYKIVIIFKDGNYEPVKVIETAIRDKCVRQVSVI